MKISARKACLILIAIVALSHTRQELRACDTWVALPDASSGGCTLLGKNSDRTNFDCQPLFLHPHVQWPAGSRIDLGRITIPQVEETFATLDSSPYWCWGYEEGINEHGVAIGNEGIRTKVFAELLATYEILHRFGAIGKHGSIAVTERINKTLKYEWLKRVALIKGIDHLADLCKEFELWYNSWRPHMTLEGLRPDDVYYNNKPEKPERNAKTVPCNIEQHYFHQKRITGYRLTKAA
jgi:hypothetical protein